MTCAVELREGGTGDADALGRLYRNVFPEEDLVPLIHGLLKPGSGTFSLIGSAEAGLVAHIAFTSCRVTGSEDKVALLGPLAVAEAARRHGVGGALIEAGFERLRADGTACVLVLGDPAFYGRFGFRPDARIVPPYPLPEHWSHAWQMLPLDGTVTVPEGTLIVPCPWRQKALWAE